MTWSSSADTVTTGSAAEEPPPPGGTRKAMYATRARRLVQAINEGDDSQVEAAVLQLSHRKRIFAPLTFARRLLMLFQGVKLLFSDWRLSLIQVVPAMSIWFAMLDLKLHVVGRREFKIWVADRGHCRPGGRGFERGQFLPELGVRVRHIQVRQTGHRPRVRVSRRHPGRGCVRLRRGVGARVFGCRGAPLGPVVVRFAMSIVVAVMMLTYVTVPSRLVGIKATSSRRDKLTASVVAGHLGQLSAHRLMSWREWGWCCWGRTRYLCWE